MAVPTRSTSQAQVDAWNAQMRQSPAYLNYMRSQGLPTNGRVKLSRSQQEGLERALAQAGMRVPSGMHIDQGGNLNQKNTLVRNVGIGAAAGGAALTGFGLAGMGPLSGLGGGSAAAAGGAGGVLPSSQLAMSPLYTGPIAGGSQGASALAAGMGAGAAGAAGAGADYLGSRPGANGVDAARRLTEGASQMNPWLQAALAGLSGIPALVAANQNKPSDEELAMQQQVKDMLAHQQRRTTFQDPLYEAVTRLAMSRLPTDSQRPIGDF